MRSKTETTTNEIMKQYQPTDADREEEIRVKNGLPVFTVQPGDTVRETYDSARSDEPQSLTGEVDRVSTPPRSFVLSPVGEGDSQTDTYTVDFQGVRKGASGFRLSEAYSARPRVTVLNETR